MRYAFGVLLLTSALTLATDAAPAPKKAAVRFPVFPTKTDVPTPPPNPSIIPTLAKGQYYVVTSDKPQLIIASGAGEVTIHTRKAPFQLPTDAAIGWTASESDPDFVTWTDPYIYLVKGKTTGDVSLEIIPALNDVDDKGKQIPLTAPSIIRKTIHVEAGQGPIPPPKPIDPVVPVTEESPFHNAPGLYVLMVFDKTAQRNYPLPVLDVLYGNKVEQYMVSHCAKGEDGQPTRRVFPSVIDATNAGKVWTDSLAYALKKWDPTKGYIIVGSGSKWEAGPLPASPDVALTLLQKYGGP